MLKILKNDKPWGFQEQITLNKKSTIQLLRILKGEELSLHYHKIRNDYWYIVNGKGEAIIDNNRILVKSGDLIYLEKHINHSVKAISDEFLVLEVCFDYFDIEDTYRVEDKYGRI